MFLIKNRTGSVELIRSKDKLYWKCTYDNGAKKIFKLNVVWKTSHLQKYETRSSTYTGINSKQIKDLKCKIWFDKIYIRKQIEFLSYMEVQFLIFWEGSKVFLKRFNIILPVIYQRAYIYHFEKICIPVLMAALFIVAKI